jgi:hypothetical protein
LHCDPELEAELEIWQRINLHAWTVVEQSFQASLEESMQHPPNQDAGPERAADQDQDGDQ